MTEGKSPTDLIFHIDTIGTLDEGVVALWARVETRGGKSVADMRCRWETPTHKIGQAFVDLHTHPGGAAAMRHPITHSDGIAAHDAVAEFFDEWRDKLVIECDPAGQVHYGPFRPWPRLSTR